MSNEKIVVHTDENGVTREYRTEKRRANVGEVAMRSVSGGIVYVQNEIFTVVKVNNNGSVMKYGTDISLFQRNYVVLVPTNVIHHEGKRYKTVERVAKVGEQLLLFRSGYHQFYNIPLVVKVVGPGLEDDSLKVVGVDECGKTLNQFVKNTQYVVLEPITDVAEPSPTSDDRIAQLEKRVATLETQMASNTSVNVNVNVSGDVSTAGIAKQIIKTCDAYKPHKPTRDEIVERAKADIEALMITSRYKSVTNLDGVKESFYPVGGSWSESDEVHFVVNRDKRAVTALIRYKDSKEVWARGIAKCAPDDVFNIHLGKAVALRRALGLDVPDEYVNAPKPTELKVGDILEWEIRKGEWYEFVGGKYTFKLIKTGHVYQDTDYKYDTLVKRIIDDSRDGNV